MTKTEAITRMVAEIQAYQERQEMTDQQIADEIGCPRSTWASARRGHFVPGRDFAAKVAKVPRFKDAAMKVLVG